MPHPDPVKCPPDVIVPQAMIGELSALDPLVKPHMTVNGLTQWPWYNYDLMKQYTRLTRVIDLGWWREVWPNQADVAKQLLAEDPTLKLSLHLSPFWLYREQMPQKYPEELEYTLSDGRVVQTDRPDRYGDPTLYQNRWVQELVELGNLIHAAKQALDDAPIWSVTMDDEAWGIWHPGYQHDQDHLSAMMHRRLAYRNALRDYLPEAELHIWEQLGEVRMEPDRGWVERGSYPRHCYGLLGPHSCQIPCTPMMEQSREIMRRTMDLAEAHGVNEVVPIISLYEYVYIETGHSEWHTKNWSAAKGYDVRSSRRMGMELNDPWFTNDDEGNVPTTKWNWPIKNLPDYSKIKCVMFEPPVLEYDSQTEQWNLDRFEHFLEYCRGAMS